MFEEEMSPRARDLFVRLSDQAADLGDALPCGNAPDLFFPDMEEPSTLANMNRAKEMCVSCPLVSLCAQYAIEAKEEFGIWGGLSANERRIIRRRLQTRRREVA